MAPKTVAVCSPREELEVEFDQKKFSSEGQEGNEPAALGAD